jgi:hypothetical protein
MLNMGILGMPICEAAHIYLIRPYIFDIDVVSCWKYSHNSIYFNLEI